MKAYQLFALALAASCTLSPAAPKKAPSDLGKVMYIGDSITHGFGAPSYRWALHKIFVDNGIEYLEVGVERGNHSNGVQPDTAYLARPFQNIHSAMSSERAYEVSGRDHTKSNRLDATGIHEWLGLKEDYSGPRKVSEMPDTFFILLGTNDTLSDYGDKGGIGKNITAALRDLLDKKKGDMNLIIDAIREANPKARIIVLSIPTWGERKQNGAPADYKAIMEKYNKTLPKKIKKVTYVDVNKGLIDIANTEKPGIGVKTFFHAGDQLHPNRHGDLIMAGLVAKALGYAGRSAGMARKPASEFLMNADYLLDKATEKTDVEVANGVLELKAGKKLVTPWPEGIEVDKGFSAEIQLNVGDGAKGGWEKEPRVVLSLGNGKVGGQLQISESYIMWNNNTILYPLDMSSKNIAPIRVTYVLGLPSQGVEKGFYVWLGDMLIGEALPSAQGIASGISLANTSTRDEKVKSLMVDTAASAPAATGYVKEAATVEFAEEAPAAQQK